MKEINWIRYVSSSVQNGHNVNLSKEQHLYYHLNLTPHPHPKKKKKNNRLIYNKTHNGGSIGRPGQNASVPKLIPETRCVTERRSRSFVNNKRPVSDSWCLGPSSPGHQFGRKYMVCDIGTPLPR